MNRAERRAVKVKPERPVFHASPEMNLKDGDLVTIAGVRRMPGGRIITTCKPGMETVHVVRVK